jgi:hypothetical protein
MDDPCQVGIQAALYAAKASCDGQPFRPASAHPESEKEKTMRPLMTVLLATLAVGLVACGGGNKSNADKFSGDKKDVGRVVDELGDAASKGDGARICNDLFTRNLEISVSRAAHRACADEVTRNVFEKGAQYDVEDLSLLKSNVANVRVKDQRDRESVLLMFKERGEWRIAKIS